MIVAFYRHCQPAGKLAKNYLYAVWVVDTLPVYKEETTDVYYDEDTPHLVDVTFYHGGSAPEGIRMVLPHRHPGRGPGGVHGPVRHAQRKPRPGLPGACPGPAGDD